MLFIETISIQFKGRWPLEQLNEEHPFDRHPLSLSHKSPFNSVVISASSFSHSQCVRVNFDLVAFSCPFFVLLYCYSGITVCFTNCKAPFHLIGSFCWPRLKLTHTSRTHSHQSGPSYWVLFWLLLWSHLTTYFMVIQWKFIDITHFRHRIGYYIHCINQYYIYR